MVTYLGRDGYVDPEDETISLLDAFYYSTVSITTTGYGDVRPASDEARLLTTILVTPARILFLILLVANSVITSSGAAGRLLGLSTHTPQITELMEDLMTIGEGLDIRERAIGPDEAIMLAVVRDGEVIRFGDPRTRELQDGDRLVELFSHPR